jgi:hypothetical protein
MRLVVLADTTNGATLGITGEVASLNNFSVVNIDRSRRAVLIHAGETYQLDTRSVQQLAGNPLGVVPWERGERTDERTNEGHSDGVQSTPRSFVRLENRDDVIALLVQAGWNVTQIRSVIKGESASIGETVKRLTEE